MPLDLVHARKLVDRHAAFDQAEAEIKNQFARFFDNVDLATGHSEAGILTAAGWVIDPKAQKLLLVYNQKLGLWLNPGGKYEPEDGTLIRTMAREVEQESGVRAWMRSPLFDTSVIDSSFNPRLTRPMFDLRFLVLADSTAPLNPKERDKTPTWFSLADAKTKMPDNIQNYRLYRRTEQKFGL